MGILDIFKNSDDQLQSIGSVECTADKLSDTFSLLMERLGMANPSAYTSKAPKGVSITKRGDVYKLTLHSFTPPVTIEWSNVFDASELISVLEKIAVEGGKRIAYYNFKKIDGFGKFQIATV